MSWVGIANPRHLWQWVKLTEADHTVPISGDICIGSFQIWRNWQTKAPAAPQHLESVHDFEEGAAAAEAHLRMPGEELGGGTKLGMFWKVSRTTFVWNAPLLQDLEVSNTSMRTSVTFSNPERVSTSWNDLNYMTYVHIVSLFLSHRNYDNEPPHACGPRQPAPVPDS